MVVAALAFQRPLILAEREVGLAGEVRLRPVVLLPELLILFTVCRNFSRSSGGLGEAGLHEHLLLSAFSLTDLRAAAVVERSLSLLPETLT